jgi:hypothetical protein
MDVEKLCHYGSRIFFAAAIVLFAVGLLEWVLLTLNVMSPLSYMPGRLVEFSAMFLVPVITVLLRQIREELRKQ